MEKLDIYTYTNLHNFIMKSASLLKLITNDLQINLKLVSFKFTYQTYFQRSQNQTGKATSDQSLDGKSAVTPASGGAWI
jgi:hypothetical protein